MKDAKEKAKDLVEQFYDIGLISYHEAKQCAIIAVKEILKYSKAHGFIGLTEEYEQVKQEIEKL